MFRGLTKLERLKLQDCEELQVVIMHEEDQDGQRNAKETLFPQLKELKLSNLQKMQRFCHMTNELELPSLEMMVIESCPMLESFSPGSLDSTSKFLFSKEVWTSNFKILSCHECYFHSIHFDIERGIPKTVHGFVTPSIFPFLLEENSKFN